MATTTNVLYLSHDGLTDPLGESQILPYLIGLSAKGTQFTIISFEKEKIGSAKRNSIDLICRHNRIIWIPLSYHRWPPLLSTLYDLWILERSVGQVIRKSNISIMHCRSYPTSLVGLSKKRKL